MGGHDVFPLGEHDDAVGASRGAVVSDGMRPSGVISTLSAVVISRGKPVDRLASTTLSTM
jgi:hypothetical protein